MTNLQMKALCASVWSFCDRLTQEGRERSEAHCCGMFNVIRLTCENYILPRQRFVRMIQMYLKWLNGIQGDVSLMFPGPRQLQIQFED